MKQKVGIIGTGTVAQKLGAGFQKVSFEGMLGILDVFKFMKVNPPCLYVVIRKRLKLKYWKFLSSLVGRVRIWGLQRQYVPLNYYVCGGVSPV